MTKSIEHHSLKEIFDGIHDNMAVLKEAVKLMENDDPSISSEDKDQIVQSMNKLKELLIELECDYSL